MAKSQLIRLPSNGNVVNTTEIIGIIRKELMVWGILIRNCPAVLACDPNDVEQIIKYMEIPTLEEAPKIQS